MKKVALFSELESQLAFVGEEPESLAFVYRSLKNLSFTEFVLSLQEEVEEREEQLIHSIFQELLQHRPAQYILGEAIFCDLAFKVDERVLIPRPETEELVQLILAENPETEQTVVDIGTGSGAIAISLAHKRENWKIAASDFSQDALDVAQENAKKMKVDIVFQESDCFEQLDAKYDLIVSNPPYIAFSDQDEVGLNVLYSEPHIALFASEEGYAVYRTIASQARDYLTADGKIYLEIGYKQGQTIATLFKDYFPEKRIRVLQDQFGKDRMVVVDNG